MWGQTLVEASLQQNFNFGFSTYKSDILLHLSQWQYWWWFWFSLVWVAYYYIIVYCITRRTFTFNPVINTSLRGHGKWGDFLVALIPLSWCGNILINSNFILRMIEWQNESSLFTLRVQGKQWYWVYKFDASSTTAILSAPKNIGHNKWLTWTPNDVLVSDSYYQAIHLAAQLEFQDSYKTLLSAKDNLQQSLDPASLMTNKVMGENDSSRLLGSKKEMPVTVSYKNVITPTTTNLYINSLSNSQAEPINRDWELRLNYLCSFLSSVDFSDTSSIYLSLFYRKQPTLSTHYDYLRVDDSSATTGNLRPLFAHQPLRFLKTPLNLFIIDNLNLQSCESFIVTPRWYLDSDAVANKVYQTENFWMFRQKKYKRLIKFLFKDRYTYDPITFQPIKLTNKTSAQISRNILDHQIKWASDQPVALLNDGSPVKVFNKKTSSSPNALKEVLRKSYESQSTITSSKPFDYYKAVRNSKSRTDLLSVTLARRLLRVKQTLVLPAHVNITVITNSYDVVHSWFIPGLGLKLDCVPGRSTHHTFYVDNVGFYYGQCAEICGRYHHHMPIRLCALTFDQFLVWWQKKGLPELCRLNMQGQSDPEVDTYFNPNNKGYNLNFLKHTTVEKIPTYKYSW